MQIGYTTVFFWEYFGPLVVYALFYFFPGVFYPTDKCVRGHLAMPAQSPFLPVYPRLNALVLPLNEGWRRA